MVLGELGRLEGLPLLWLPGHPEAGTGPPLGIAQVHLDDVLDFLHAVNNSFALLPQLRPLFQQALTPEQLHLAGLSSPLEDGLKGFPGGLGPIHGRRGPVLHMAPELQLGPHQGVDFRLVGARIHRRTDGHGEKLRGSHVHLYAVQLGARHVVAVVRPRIVRVGGHLHQNVRGLTAVHTICAGLDDHLGVDRHVVQRHCVQHGLHLSTVLIQGAGLGRSARLCTGGRGHLGLRRLRRLVIGRI